MFGVSYRPFRGVTTSVSGRGVGSTSKPITFATVYEAEPSTTITSRKAYPKNIPTDTAITVSAGAQYSLDGGAWTSEPGVWGASKFIQVRGPSNADYELAVIHTVTIGTLELDFTIWTKEAPAVVNAALWTESDEWIYNTPFTL